MNDVLERFFVDGVSSGLVADKNGLLLTSKGVENATQLAALLTSVLFYSTQIKGSSIVSIKTDAGKWLLDKEGDLTIALFKPSTTY